MLMSVIALAVTMQPCPKSADLPAGLAGWSRTGTGLDTRHATMLDARGGRIETRVTIRKAGIFGIAVDGEGWVDVAPAKGKPLRMVSQNRGPRCSGIAKIVRYRLRPGEYRVTVARLDAKRVRLMLVHGGFARPRRSG